MLEISGDGKERFKTQKFSKIKVTAKAQDVYDVAIAMADIIAYSVRGF